METPTEDFSLALFVCQVAGLTAFFALCMALICYAPQVDAWLREVL